MVEHAAPKQHFLWPRCDKSPSGHLTEWTLPGPDESSRNGLVVYNRELEEALATGLSRLPSHERIVGPTLGDFARVMRGIATGANEFFFLTTEQARALRIPDEFLIQAIGRTRDLSSDEITFETLKSLE